MYSKVSNKIIVPKKDEFFVLEKYSYLYNVIFKPM
jgi:hypothetical protein